MIKKPKAFHDYKNGMKIKDIAKRYDVSSATVRSWKSRYWKNHSKSSHKKRNRNVATKSKRNKNVATPKLDFSELNNSNLTSKQKLFCKLYLKYYNATKAYKLAYKCSYEVANKHASSLVVNRGVKAELTKLQKQRDDKLYINSNVIIQSLVKMFFADLGDYIKFGHKQEQDLDTGEKYQKSYVYLKNQNQVDTSPVAEIHIGKDGTQVKLPDKIKLAKLLLKYLPEPINHSVKSDTLISAFKQGLKNSKKHHSN